MVIMQIWDLVGKSFFLINVSVIKNRVKKWVFQYISDNNEADEIANLWSKQTKAL